MRTIFVFKIVIFTSLFLFASSNLRAQFLTEDGSVSFLTDGLKGFNIRHSTYGSRLQIGIAEGAGHYFPGANTGDVILRRMGTGSKLIITSGTTHNFDPSRATGVLASISSNGLWVHNNGNIRLGEYSTTAPDVKLVVQGAIRAREIKVEAQTADFVFEEDYYLRPLEEVESFILENKHLPEIPNAAQMEAEGTNLAEMNKLLLMKIEELTLYMIEQQKMINELKGAISKE